MKKLKDQTKNRIQSDLTKVSAILSNLIDAVKEDTGKRMVNKLTRLLHFTSEIFISFSDSEHITSEKFIEIYRKALRLKDVAGFATVKNARIIATEIYKIPVDEFNSFLKKAIENGAIEFARGMSQGLTTEDGQEYNTFSGTDTAFYFSLKHQR